MNAIAPGLRSDIDDRISNAAGGSFENFVAHGDAEGEGVDEDVAVVAGVKGCLAADGRNPDAVAVAADAAHDAVDEIAHARRVHIAEAERVETRDRPRAHGEDVAQNSA